MKTETVTRGARPESRVERLCVEWRNYVERRHIAASSSSHLVSSPRRKSMPSTICGRSRTVTPSEVPIDVSMVTSSPDECAASMFIKREVVSISCPTPLSRSDVTDNSFIVIRPKVRTQVAGGVDA